MRAHRLRLLLGTSLLVTGLALYECECECECACGGDEITADPAASPSPAR